MVPQHWEGAIFEESPQAQATAHGPTKLRLFEQERLAPGDEVIDELAGVCR